MQSIFKTENFQSKVWVVVIVTINPS